MSLISKVPHAKMYQIMNTGERKDVEIGGKTMEFKHDIFHTPDQHIAQAIADKYPYDTMSIPHDSWRDDPTGVHHYHFGTPRGNWKERIDWSK